MLPLAPGEVMSEFTSSIIKLRTGKCRQAISTLWVDIVGADVRRWETERPFNSAGQGLSRDMMRLAAPRYLNDRAQSIFGGSSEIQHDIMARTLLQER